MNRELRAAAYVAALLAGCIASAASAGDTEPADDRFGQLLSIADFDPTFGNGFAAGSWTVGPIAEIRLPPGDASSTERLFARGPELPEARLGFRGSAKIDSRIGALFSRLSLSFKHEFRANDHRVVSGYPAARRTGFYGDRAEVDVMTADAVFAMPLSKATFGILEYGAEMEPGDNADHQVTLRLRFAF